eukprot:3842503-Rhodomonas_salina.3
MPCICALNARYKSACEHVSQYRASLRYSMRVRREIKNKKSPYALRPMPIRPMPYTPYALHALGLSPKP